MQKTIKMEKFVIKNLLKERDMTFQQLADLLKIHRTNLYSSLSGNPTLTRLEEIANVLKVDVVDLFAKVTNKENKLNGFIEYKEQVHKITCIADLEEFMRIVKEE